MVNYVVNCVATLKHIDHLADVNATDILRKIIMTEMAGSPHSQVERRRSDLRERGESLSSEHIGKFLRKRVKAEFDPDFANIHNSERCFPLHPYRSET